MQILSAECPWGGSLRLTMLHTRLRFWLTRDRAATSTDKLWQSTVAGRLMEAGSPCACDIGKTRNAGTFIRSTCRSG
jgi:hypothetical protein